MMAPAEVDLFESLDFYNWYKELISKYNCEEEEILRKVDRKVIETILKDLGYCFSYYSSSKIFNVPTKYNGIDFYCNPEIKDGLVRVYLYAENSSSKVKVGDNLISICRLIEIAKGKDSGKYMLLPRFRNHEELKEIMRSIFDKYEEFKVAVIDSKILKSNHPA